MQVAATPQRRQTRSRVEIVDLIWTIIRTDFKTRYHGTVGGFLWALLKPATMCLVLIMVFSFLFAQDENYPVNLVLGIFLYDLFNEGTRTGVTSLLHKGFLIGKTPFPHWVLPVTASANALATIVAASVVIVSALALGPGLSLGAIALYAWYVFHLLVMVIGINIATCTLFLRYRDLNQVWEVVTQAGFFVAPVIYPLSVIPEKYHAYLYLWPPTPVIQFCREVLVMHQVPSLTGHVLLSCLALGCLVLGFVVYGLHRRRLAEML